MLRVCLIFITLFVFPWSAPTTAKAASRAAAPTSTSYANALKEAKKIREAGQSSYPLALTNVSKWLTHSDPRFRHLAVETLTAYGIKDRLDSEAKTNLYNFWWSTLRNKRDGEWVDKAIYELSMHYHGHSRTGLTQTKKNFLKLAIPHMLSPDPVLDSERNFAFGSIDTLLGDQNKDINSFALEEILKALSSGKEIYNPEIIFNSGSHLGEWISEIVEKYSPEQREALFKKFINLPTEQGRSLSFLTRPKSNPDNMEKMYTYLRDRALVEKDAKRLRDYKTFVSPYLDDMQRNDKHVKILDDDFARAVKTLKSNESSPTERKKALWLLKLVGSKISYWNKEKRLPRLKELMKLSKNLESKEEQLTILETIADFGSSDFDRNTESSEKFYAEAAKDLLERQENTDSETEKKILISALRTMISSHSALEFVQPKLMSLFEKDSESENAYLVINILSRHFYDMSDEKKVDTKRRFQEALMKFDAIPDIAKLGEEKTRPQVFQNKRYVLNLKMMAHDPHGVVSGLLATLADKKKPAEKRRAAAYHLSLTVDALGDEGWEKYIDPIASLIENEADHDTARFLAKTAAQLINPSWIIRKLSPEQQETTLIKIFNAARKSPSKRVQTHLASIMARKLHKDTRDEFTTREERDWVRGILREAVRSNPDPILRKEAVSLLSGGLFHDFGEELSQDDVRTLGYAARFDPEDEIRLEAANGFERARNKLLTHDPNAGNMIETLEGVADPCKVICNAVDKMAEWFPPTEDFKGPFGMREDTTRYAMQAISSLLMVEASPICENAKDWVEKIVRTLHTHSKVTDNWKGSDAAKVLEKDKTSQATGYPAGRPLDSIEMYGKIFSKIWIEELLKSSYPLSKEERNKLDIYLRAHKSSLHRNAGFAYRARSGKGGSLFNTFLLSLTALHVEHDDLALLLKDSNTKDLWNVLYSPRGSDTGERGSSGRIVPFYLTKYQEAGGSDESLNHLLGSLEKYKEYLPDLEIHFLRDGVHTGTNGIAPYYFIPSALFVGPTANLIENDRRLTDKNRSDVKDVKKALRNSLLSLVGMNGLFRTHGSFIEDKEGVITWGGIQNYPIPLGALSLIPLLNEDDACYADAKKAGEDYGILKHARIRTAHIKKVSGKERTTEQSKPKTKTWWDYVRHMNFQPF